MSTTTTTVAAQGQTTRLSGLGITGAAAGDTLAVTLATSHGTLHVNTSTGITLAYGNSATGASVAFTGSTSQVNAALAAVDLAAPAGSAGESATISVTAYEQQDGIVYGSATGRFYEFVSAPGSTWTQANTAAGSRSFLGKSGYLVTITSVEENALVTSRIPDAINVWIGAQADGAGGYARSWHWVGGPEAGQVFSQCSNILDTCDFAGTPGYSHWADSEPNNSDDARGGETVAVTNWNYANGEWNDLAATNTDEIAGYVVEYGDGTAFPGVSKASSTVSIVDVPGAPTGVTATAGTEQATVSFTAPASDGGSAITGYTVTASPGGATATCTASPCVVTGLTGAQAYTFRVTATSAVGTSNPSSASTAVTVAARPTSVSAPTAVAGVSSATVSWTASTDPDVTGYTVTAQPGPATCTTTTATSCVIGAVAGTPVTFTVVAHTSRGDSAASPASAPVTPTSPEVLTTPPSSAPTTLTTDKGTIAQVLVGEKVTVIGTGFAPYSTATVVIYSTPQVLATVTTDATGAFRTEVTVPTSLAAGQHHLVAYGVEPSGAVRSIQLPVTVPAATKALAATGLGTGQIGLVIALLLGTGVSLKTASVRLAGRPLAGRRSR